MKDSFMTLLAYSFPLMFIVFIFYYNYLAFNGWKTNDYLIKHGELTTGVVIKKEESRSKTGPIYYLTYTYQSPGSSEVIKQKQIVDYNTNLLNREGKEIEILYDPRQQNRSQIKGNDAYSMDIFITALLDLIVLILIVTTAFKYYKHDLKSKP